jgi:hypothetical protein
VATSSSLGQYHSIAERGLMGIDDVLGDVDQHGPGPPGGREVEGLADHERDVLGLRDELVVLGHRAGDADGVALLEGVGADGPERHLAGDAHHRDRVHVGIAQRGDDVGRRRPRRHHAHTRPSRGVGETLGHVPRTLLVAHEDVADGAVDDRIVDGEDGPARQAEHDLDALHLEGLDQRLSAVELHGGVLLSDVWRGVG